MNKIIEIKGIELNSVDTFIADKYHDSGIYEVTDENNNRVLVYVNKRNFSVTYLDSDSSLIPLYRPNDNVVKSNSDVSEEFALKMLHTALHGKESDIKDI